MYTVSSYIFNGDILVSNCDTLDDAYDDARCNVEYYNATTAEIVSNDGTVYSAQIDLKTITYWNTSK